MVNTMTCNKCQCNLFKVVLDQNAPVIDGAKHLICSGCGFCWICDNFHYTENKK